MKKLIAICFILLISCKEENKVDFQTKNQSNDTIVETNNVEPTKEIPQKTISKPKFVASEIIPKGYTILDSVTGNLNLDDFQDMILVLKKTNEENTDTMDDEESRPLYILLGDINGSYTIAAKNNKTVYCSNCGGIFGDPYEGITIKNGYFSVEHYGGSNWRWTKIITYKYVEKEKNWFLHKDGSTSFHTSNPDEATTKIRTTKDFGKVEFTKFNIYSE